MSDEKRTVPELNDELGATGRKNIIKIAKEAGIDFKPAGPGEYGIDTWYGNQWLPSGSLQKFADLVTDAERSRCLGICNYYDGDEIAARIETAIRNAPNLEMGDIHER